jgi:hypothetical protein
MKAIVAYSPSGCEPQRGPSNVHAQARAIRRHAEHPISWVYMDAGASVLTQERPALPELIADCRAGKIGV